VSAEQGVPELSIVIPAYSEEATVFGVIAADRDVARALARDVEILACHDGSEDGTWDVLPRPRLSGRAKGVTPLGALHAAVDAGRIMLRDLLGGRR